MNMLPESRRHAVSEVVSSESVWTQEMPHEPAWGLATGAEDQPLDAPAIDAAVFDELGLA